MGLKRFCLVGLASALLWAVSASPASAATVPITFECTSDTTITASPGDTLVLTAGSSCPATGNTYFMMNINGTSIPPAGGGFPGSPGGWPSGSGWSGTATAYGFLQQATPSVRNVQAYANSAIASWYAGGFNPSEFVQATLESTDGAGNSLVDGSVIAAIYFYPGDSRDGTTATLRFSTGSGSNGSTSDNSPGPWLKAVGRQADDTCPVGMHPSWAQWPFGGTGGFTCEWREQLQGNSQWVSLPGFGS